MKTMIDIDDEALELAARELGTTTKKDTVNAALAFVAGRRDTAKSSPESAVFGTEAFCREAGGTMGPYRA